MDHDYDSKLREQFPGLERDGDYDMYERLGNFVQSAVAEAQPAYSPLAEREVTIKRGMDVTFTDTSIHIYYWHDREDRVSGYGISAGNPFLTEGQVDAVIALMQRAANAPGSPAIVEAVKALANERMYEFGRKEFGVSPAFLMRITMLKHAAGLIPDDDPFYVEAKTYFEEQAKLLTNGKPDASG